ncbi:hypothetical protein JOB18_009268 [Solea senegalensis]|uniref:Uncharacterized protein n=1 Tax=Solea senegalensis TaxID=28829 RepID=A0AAV6SH40_SOLSE|nr:hypothetical protein JOB18_009268 [Solea senegalensis]
MTVSVHTLIHCLFHITFIVKVKQRFPVRDETLYKHYVYSSAVSVPMEMLLLSSSFVLNVSIVRRDFLQSGALFLTTRVPL